MTIFLNFAFLILSRENWKPHYREVATVSKRSSRTVATVSNRILTAPLIVTPRWPLRLTRFPLSDGTISNWETLSWRKILIRCFGDVSILAMCVLQHQTDTVSVVWSYSEKALEIFPVSVANEQASPSVSVFNESGKCLFLYLCDSFFVAAAFGITVTKRVDFVSVTVRKVLEAIETVVNVRSCYFVGLSEISFLEYEDHWTLVKR